MLCEKCHQREATCHLTRIAGENLQASHLCDECFEASSPEMHKARCQYCGHQAGAGGADLLELPAGSTQMRSRNYLCIACSGEYHRFMQTQLATLPKFKSEQEQWDAVRATRATADSYMKQWVAKTLV